MSYLVTHRYETQFPDEKTYRKEHLKGVAHLTTLERAIRKSYQDAFEPLSLVEFGLRGKWVPVYSTDTPYTLWARWVRTQPKRIRYRTRKDFP